MNARRPKILHGTKLTLTRPPYSLASNRVHEPRDLIFFFQMDVQRAWKQTHSSLVLITIRKLGDPLAEITNAAPHYADELHLA